MYTLHLGNSLTVLPTVTSNSIDAIVCDPPYELGFMGKSWDASGIAYNLQLWQEAFRVLKPGGHLLAFSGSRTYHRMTCAIEDAGFEIRDQILWVYGSGFPKSLDVSKAIDKAAGAEREVIGFDPVAANRTPAIGTTAFGDYKGQTGDVTAPATPATKQWQGWGTALKPAHEPICVARKPLTKGLTVAANVLEHGTGALNIDGCRVATEEIRTGSGSRSGNIGWGTGNPEGNRYESGRWPANLIHDGSDEVVALFPSQAGAAAPVKGTEHSLASTGNVTGRRERVSGEFHGDTGSAARFFYCAKTSKKDRNEGLEMAPIISASTMTGRKEGSAGLVMEGGKANPYAGTTGEARANSHPTVKPTDLMRYLCRLVTPPGGTVLDPFMGSGSTGKAAMLEGFRFVGVEMSEEYMAIAAARIEAAFESTIADMI